MRFFLAALLLGAAYPCVFPLYEDNDTATLWTAVPQGGKRVTVIVVPAFCVIPGLFLGAAVALLRRKARIALWLSGASLGALAVIGLAGRWILGAGPQSGVTASFLWAAALNALAFALIWVGRVNAEATPQR